MASSTATATRRSNSTATPRTRTSGTRSRKTTPTGNKIEAVPDVTPPASTENKETPVPEMTHSFLLMNGSGVFQVHKADCPRVAADLKKSDYAAAMKFSPTSQEDAIRQLWDDQIREQAAGDGIKGDPDVAYLFDHGYVGETKFHSCAKLDKIVQPKPEKDPAGAKRAAKTELATRAVEAIAAMVKDLPADNPLVTALGGPDEVAKCAAHWVHHLPADRERWVAAGLPKPDRSDWR